MRRLLGHFFKLLTKHRFGVTIKHDLKPVPFLQFSRSFTTLICFRGMRGARPAPDKETNFCDKTCRYTLGQELAFEDRKIYSVTSSSCVPSTSTCPDTKSTECDVKPVPLFAFQIRCQQIPSQL